MIGRVLERGKSTLRMFLPLLALTCGACKTVPLSYEIPYKSPYIDHKTYEKFAPLLDRQSQLYKSPRAYKMHKSLTICMNKALARMSVTKYMSYRMPVGKAIRSNLANVMKPCFSRVETIVSDTCPPTNDYTLNVDLVEHKIQMGVSILSTHKVYLNMVFLLYDKNQHLLFRLTADALGTNKMTEEQVFGEFEKGLIGGLVEPSYVQPDSQRAYLKAMALAFDHSLGQILTKLMARMDDFLANPERYENEEAVSEMQTDLGSARRVLDTTPSPQGGRKSLQNLLGQHRRGMDEPGGAVPEPADDDYPGPFDDLKDPDWQVRKQAALDLAEIGNKRSVKALIGILRDSHRYVRGAAARSLGEIGDSRAVPPLIRAFADRYLHVRASVAEALGKLGDDRAIVPLQQRLKDKSSVVRKIARDALQKLEVQ